MIPVDHFFFTRRTLPRPLVLSLLFFLFSLFFLQFFGLMWSCSKCHTPDWAYFFSTIHSTQSGSLTCQWALRGGLYGKEGFVVHCFVCQLMLCCGPPPGAWPECLTCRFAPPPSWPLRLFFFFLPGPSTGGVLSQLYTFSQIFGGSNFIIKKIIIFGI